jgi:thiol:disulfide interchange protein DsbA
MITDLARFYERTSGIKQETFLSTSGSFEIDVNVRQTDQLIASYGVAETPSFVVNGKYRLNPVSAGGDAETIALVKWLVERESTGAH